MVVALHLAENGHLGDIRRNRLLLKACGGDDIGLVEEHHGLAEALALLHHLDDLFDALGRGEGHLTWPKTTIWKPCTHHRDERWCHPCRSAPRAFPGDQCYFFFAELIEENGILAMGFYIDRLMISHALLSRYLGSSKHTLQVANTKSLSRLIANYSG